MEEKRVPLLLLAILMLSGLLLSDGVGTVTLEPRYWISGISADGLLEENGIGTAVDFQDDLGMDDESATEFRLHLHTGPYSRVRIDYATTGFEGDRVLNRTVEFNGETYDVGTRVLSNLDLDLFGVGWIWQFYRNGSDTLRLGTLLEAKGISAEASLAAPDLSIDADESLDVVVPAIGFSLEADPSERLHLFLEVAGMSAGSSGSILDGEAGFGYRLTGFFLVTGGYRVLDIEVEDEPDYLNLTLAGPFLSFRFTF